MGNYKFSIILTVYNDEKYLKDSIESIINQDIGFKDNVQFIIVNDGSTDESENIIRQYASKFSDNIVALFQENKGLACARNLALDFVEGQYVNFFDVDDYLCEDVLSTVYNFFELNQYVNIASISINFFEKCDDDYELNYKNVNSEIIDLSLYPNNPLLSISSCFIKKELIGNEKFNTNLIYSEDSLFLNKLLIKDNKYAFIPSVILYQRLRNDLTNRSQNVIFNKKYFTERLRNFHIDLINHSLLNNSNVPKFIQYTLLYDLLCLIKKPELDVFDEESEKEEFFEVLTEFFSYIDDDVINNNCYVDNPILKSFLFYLKNRNINYELNEFDVKLKFGNYVADILNTHKFWLNEVKFKDEYLHIEGFFNSLFNIEDISISAVKEKNGKYDFYSGAYFNNSKYHSTKFLSKTFLYSYSFILNIPTRDLVDSNFKLCVNYHKNGNKFDNRRENLISSYLDISFTYLSEFDNNLMNSGDFSLSLKGKCFYVKKGFKFSVVMAIYNTEDYVEQAIDSVINQTIGFEENIQLILVNDGSTDGTENILLNYKKLYPNNIVLINQENHGQASARNNGLNYVLGKYVNFLDSDDYLSENVMEEVHDFFEEHESETDVVSIPIVMFERSDEIHPLDYKFNKSRVIDLTIEPNNPQLHVSSSFIKFDSVKDIKFPTTIVGSEDSNFVNNILLYKKKLGVINEGIYFYRKRENITSTMDMFYFNENYYIPRLKDCFMNLINQSLDMYGEVPRFIQYTLVYDLQWLLLNSELEIYTEKSDINEFWYYIDVIFSYIDLSVITDVCFNFDDFNLRTFLIFLKKKNLHFEVKNDEILLNADNYHLDRLNMHKIWLDIVEIKDGFLNISGFLNSLFDSKFLSISAVKTLDDGSQAKYCGKYVEYSSRKGVKFLDNQWMHSFNFDLKVPLAENEYSKITLLLNFHYDGDNTNIINSNVLTSHLDLKFLSHARISEKSNYIVKDNHIVYFGDNEFIIIPYSYKSLIKLENNVINTIISEKPNYYISIIGLRLVYLLLCAIMKNKKIFLFQDRIDSADDNAEHLFKYAMLRNDGVKKYFVLSKDSVDYSRLSKIGSIVKYNSFKHRLLYLLADKVISSHPDESILSPFFSYWDGIDQRKYMNSLVTSGTYFLQHGVTSGNVSKWLKKYDKNLRLVVTVSDDEAESFLDGGYGYDEEIVKVLGFPRFDNLKNNPKNKILIIPTWRNYLEGNRSVFMNSDYFKSLNELINDETLITLCEKNNYEIIFKPHPRLNTQISDEDVEKYVDLFNFNKHIKLSTEESYQELFEECGLLITDYSSVFFDFAYLKKPVIYYQPNDDYHHEKSYFKYETMGFGDVINNHEDIITKIEEYINNGCEMESIYKDNVDNFFKYFDKNNCQRVYDWITKN